MSLHPRMMFCKIALLQEEQFRTHMVFIFICKFSAEKRNNTLKDASEVSTSQQERPCPKGKDYVILENFRLNSYFEFPKKFWKRIELPQVSPDGVAIAQHRELPKFEINGIELLEMKQLSLLQNLQLRPIRQ